MDGPFDSLKSNGNQIERQLLTTGNLKICMYFLLFCSPKILKFEIGAPFFLTKRAGFACLAMVCLQIFELNPVILFSPIITISISSFFFWMSGIIYTNFSLTAFHGMADCLQPK